MRQRDLKVLRKLCSREEKKSLFTPEALHLRPGTGSLWLDGTGRQLRKECEVQLETAWFPSPGLIIPVNGHGRLPWREQMDVAQLQTNARGFAKLNIQCYLSQIGGHGCDI